MEHLQIYIHIPFCVRKCAYCDFLSAPADADTRERYVQALEREIAGRAAQEGPYGASTVFLGGGTPSLLTPGQIGRLLCAVDEAFPILPEAEITMEANPGTVDLDSLRGYRRAGVNRLSLGLQSTWDGELQMLGRLHTWQQFLDSYGAAVQAGFVHINVDLMSGLPGQTPDSYEESLRRVAGLTPAPEHISAYSLIPEEGTDLARLIAEGALALPDEDTERRLYALTGRILREYGYERYEISNYAREACVCRHNVGYWMRENYLGFGIGAASLLNNTRFQNQSSLQAYLEHPLGQRVVTERLTEAGQMAESLILGLRLVAGVGEQEFRAAFHRGLEEVYGEAIRKHMEEGLLVWREGTAGRRLCLTGRGLDLANYVMADFLEPDAAAGRTGEQARGFERKDR